MIAMSNDLQTTPAPRVSSQDKLLKLVQERYPGYHPVVSMAELAHDTKDESIELACHKEVAKYVVAVDRFVEVKQEVKQTRRVVVEMFGAADHPSTQKQPVLDVHGSEVLDAQPRMVGRGETEMLEQRTVTRTSGQVADDGADPDNVWAHRVMSPPATERPKHDALLGVWGDGEATTGASGFA